MTDGIMGYKFSPHTSVVQWNKLMIRPCMCFITCINPHLLNLPFRKQQSVNK